MADNEKLLWRPNDNSPKTKLKYDLEMNHWLSSLRDSTSTPTTSVEGVFGFLGLLFSFIFNIIHFIVLMLIEFVVWIRKSLPKKKVKRDIPNFDNRRILTDEEYAEIFRNMEKGVYERVYLDDVDDE
jgi:hypothetical protein